MFGDFDQMVKRQKDFFTTNQLRPMSTKVAIDLGAGPGFQSMALDQLGFSVLAVDFSEELLAELIKKNSQIETRTTDLRDLSYASSMAPELIVCMGDTLTHLSDLLEVRALIMNCYSALVLSGKLVFTYRDLSSPLIDTDRFIPVKSDDERILTCFLEDLGETVKVTDLFYQKIEGNWQLKKSSYTKIKITASWLKFEMESLGFNVELSRLSSGMEVVIAQKK